MPPYRPVKSLKSLCEDVLFYVIAKYKQYIINESSELKIKQESDTLNVAERYILMCDLPDEVYTDLANKVFQQFKDPVKLMQFFFNKKLKRLEINRELNSCVVSEIENLIGSASKIKHFRCNHSNLEKLSASSFTAMRNLNSFVFHSFCTDEILEVISENCSNLQELELCWSRNITDISCVYLEKFKSLKKLDLYCTEITAPCLAEFLLKNQTIMKLEVHYSNEIFNYLMSKRSELLEPFCLKKITPEIGDEEEFIEFASWFCPDLTSSNKDIQTIHSYSFKNLLTLNLFSIEDYNESLKYFIQHCGSILISLGIRESQIDDKELIYNIMEYCTNLKHLILYKVECDIYFEIKTTETGKYCLNLETCKMSMSGESNLFELILRNCKNIKQIEVGGDYLNNDIIYNTLSTTGMPNLEKFGFLGLVEVGISFIKMLLNSCPKLKSIGSLVSCMNIAHEDIILLKRDAKLFNWDIDIDTGNIYFMDGIEPSSW